MLNFVGFMKVVVEDMEIASFNDDSTKKYGLSFSTTKIISFIMRRVSFTRGKRGLPPSTCNQPPSTFLMNHSHTSTDFEDMSINNGNSQNAMNFVVWNLITELVLEDLQFNGHYMVDMNLIQLLFTSTTFVIGKTIAV